MLHNSHYAPEAEFLDVIGTKVLRVFSLQFTVNSKQIFETGLSRKHCTRKPQALELSRLCTETSTTLYVHEFGFWPHFVVS
jgi:hypothetical protein